MLGFLEARFSFQRKGRTMMGTRDQNMYNLLFKGHFLMTFPKEGPGSVDLSLIRKQILPKEVLGAEGAESNIKKGQGTLCESHKANISFPPTPQPSPCVSPVSELFPNSKTEVPPQRAKKSSCQIQQSTH